MDKGHFALVPLRYKSFPKSVWVRDKARSLFPFCGLRHPTIVLAHALEQVRMVWVNLEPGGTCRSRNPAGLHLSGVFSRTNRAADVSRFV